MLILGIESSCDETGVALYDTDKGLIADALHTQIEMHRLYGGVVPELASRDHIRRIIPLLNEVMKKAGKMPQDLDAVAVTEGPGLAGALLVGNSVAYGIGLALDIPVVGIHHLEGHLLSSLLAEDKPTFPFIALLVSGGHTQIMEVRALGDYELLGETLDDAAGEAFDKTAQAPGCFRTCGERQTRRHRTSSAFDSCAELGLQLFRPQDRGHEHRSQRTEASVSGI